MKKNQIDIMSKRAYVKPQFEVFLISKPNLLAGSPTLQFQSTGEEYDEVSDFENLL